MAKAQVKVKVSSGKKGNSGTVLVRQHVVIVKNNAQAKPYGKPFYQTKAQLNVYIWNKDGKPRAKSRFN